MIFLILKITFETLPCSGRITMTWLHAQLNIHKFLIKPSIQSIAGNTASHKLPI